MRPSEPRRRRRRGSLKPESLSQIAKLGESISTSIAAAAALALVAGYVVVSLHYSRLGLSNMDFFQPLYVIAGIWALLPFVFVYGTAAALEFGFEETWPFVSRFAPGAVRPLLAIATFVLVLGVYALFLRFVVLGWVTRPGPLLAPFDVPPFVVAIAFLWPLVHYAFSNLHRLFPRVRPMPVRISGLLFMLCIGLQSVIVGSLVYVYIPASLGGGGPLQVQFLSAGAPGARSAGPIEASRPYLLYAQSSTAYVARELFGGRRLLVFAKGAFEGYVSRGDIAIDDAARLLQSVEATDPAPASLSAPSDSTAGTR
jgi:hypothetical protein